MAHNLSSYIFYVGQKDPIKVPILTISSALVKICQIPHVMLQFSFSSNFVSLFNVMVDNSHVLFSSNNIYLAQKEPNKVKIFRVLRSKFVKFLMSILKRTVDSSTNFVSLFSFMKDNSTVLF